MAYFESFRPVEASSTEAAWIFCGSGRGIEEVASTGKSMVADAVLDSTQPTGEIQALLLRHSDL